MAAENEVEESDFKTITRRLIPRAAMGRGRVAAVGPMDSEDVVQGAWEKVVRQDALASGISGAELEAYVHQALVDVSRDHRRAQQRKRVVPAAQQVQLEAVSEAELGASYPHDEWHAAEAAHGLRATVVEIVGEDCARYAELVAQDFTEKEIAAELRMSEGEIGRLRKRFARARPALADAINQRLSRPKEDR